MDDLVTNFLDAIDARLDAGAQEYGNQSFVKPIAETARQILEEALDQAGWCYVLWCQAARKVSELPKDQPRLRLLWRQRLEHRIRRSDRKWPSDPHCHTAAACMTDLEVLVLDLFQHHDELQMRLQPIARAIEVARVMQPDNYQGRRGGRSFRSDD